MDSGHHILLLVSSLRGGGAERVAARLANAWVGRGHRVTLVPTYPARETSAYPLDEKIDLEFLSDEDQTQRKTLWLQMRRLMALRRLITTCEPDVVVSFQVNVNVAALLATLGSSIPVLVAERVHPEQFPSGFVLDRLRLLTYPSAARIVVQTETTARWFAAHLRRSALRNAGPGAAGQRNAGRRDAGQRNGGQSRGAVEVIPNPVFWPLEPSEPQLAPELLLADGEKLILAVGRLDPQKGFEDLIAAFHRISGKLPEWRLVIIGEGDRKPVLEASITELGLDGWVMLPGWVGNLGDWYERADLFVLSSRYEGFPNALLEAMSYGVACVSFDCDTGPRDIIRDGIDGRLVAPEAGPDGLAEAVSRLAEDEAARIRLSYMAQEVRQRFAMEKILILWERLFSAAIGSAAGSAGRGK